MKTCFFIRFFLFAGLSCTMIGCNTIRGVGEDISGSANFVEKKMTGEDVPNSNPPQWPK